MFLSPYPHMKKLNWVSLGRPAPEVPFLLLLRLYFSVLRSCAALPLYRLVLGYGLYPVGAPHIRVSSARSLGWSTIRFGGGSLPGLGSGITPLQSFGYVVHVGVASGPTSLSRWVGELWWLLQSYETSHEPSVQEMMALMLAFLR